MYHIIGAEQLTEEQRRQALLPHRLGGMGMQDYMFDVDDAAV